MSSRVRPCVFCSTSYFTGLLCALLTQLAFGLSADPDSSLPGRLVILIDGVAYRDVVALQSGITYTNARGRQATRQAFHEGYFPVSRLISTFPSASDVAWSEILGNRPLPGYQRTYLCAATGELIRQNGVTTSMEYELQMHWELESGIRRALGYVYPSSTFRHEVGELVQAFLESAGGSDAFYGMIRASDDAQHTTGDILKLLCFLDRQLQKLCALYRAVEGHDLEILMLSDHGNNHAGAGKRVQVRSYLKRAGYHLTDAIRNPEDLVLPTVGIQNWVEINCAPGEIGKLALMLAELEGVDVVTARLPGPAGHFLVLNGEGDRALIVADPGRDSYRYEVQRGDPLGYAPVVAALTERGCFEESGFASAQAWTEATMAHRYPLAPERIVRGHTRLALNPAPLLISLENGYIHSSWMLKQLSSLMRMGGTHGGLDDLCSTGSLLSNFEPTRDTSARQVARQFDGFRGLRDPREGEQGGEWIYRDIQALAAVARGQLDWQHTLLPESAPLLRVWTPVFSGLQAGASLEVTLRPERRFSSPRIRRSDPVPSRPPIQHLTLDQPLAFQETCDYERVYLLPDAVVLDSLETYRIRGSVDLRGRNTQVFEFTFHTDSQGLPLVQ